MRSKYIRIVVIMAVISILGIMVMQVVWFKKAYDLKQRQFDHIVFLALQNVGETILEYNKLPIPLSGTVSQISTNYYAVNVNGEIETSVLEHLLKTEFEKRKILLDFEYGVYNCDTEKMVYGNYISMNNKNIRNVERSHLPIWTKDRYYFSVLFPEKTSYLAGQMGIWLFFNGVLLLICLFFGYATIIILKQKRLSEVQKDFVNNMTHELKTPVSTILVSTKLLKKEEVIENPKRIADYVNLIENETTRLKTLIEHVLKVALLDKDKLHFETERINIHEAILAVTKSQQLLINEKEGLFELDLQADKQEILGDPIHINNILYNLIDNSVKYCQTKPAIKIQTRIVKKYIQIIVTDNGIGISKEHIKRVFEKFYRVPTGNIHNVKGYGLGLYYVKTIVDWHKGKLEIASKPDSGTEIKIFLPYM